MKTSFAEFYTKTTDDSENVIPLFIDCSRVVAVSYAVNLDGTLRKGLTDIWLIGGGNTPFTVIGEPENILQTVKIHCKE